MREAADHAPWDDGRPLVLIIDAEETARDLYGHWFSSIGFQVMCAVGVSGLRLALHRERPHLIISELSARDLTLAKLFQRLRSEESTRCIPVVVVTDCCEQSRLVQAKAAGAVAVLPKLVGFDLLRAWVSALVQMSPTKGSSHE